MKEGKFNKKEYILIDILFSVALLFVVVIGFHGMLGQSLGHIL